VVLPLAYFRKNHSIPKLPKELYRRAMDEYVPKYPPNLFEKARPTSAAESIELYNNNANW
jgi:hypothetical protein